MQNHASDGKYSGDEMPVGDHRDDALIEARRAFYPPKLRKDYSKFVAMVLIVVLFTFGTLAFVIADPAVKYVPSYRNIFLLFCCFMINIFVKSPLARYAFMFWLIWFILGSISLYAQNQLSIGLNYNIDPDQANQYYLSCVLSGILGALTFQVIRSGHIAKQVHLPDRGTNSLVWLMAIAFPFIYVLSIIFYTGRIPIFSGENISGLMYELDYGPVHAFGIFVPVCCTMAWMRFNKNLYYTKRSMKRNLFFALFLLFAVSASADGRRVLTLFSIMAAILYYISLPIGRARWVWAGLIGGGTLIIYVASAALRGGGDASAAFSNVATPLAAVGTEYRDFIYGFTSFTPAYVKTFGYDWTGSTLASLTPSLLFAPLGINKGDLAIHDSAKTLMVLWNVKLGIRIGLPGELWFEFQWYSLLLFFLFGALILFLSDIASKSRNFFYKSILIVVITIFTMSVNGQSTVTFGLILPLIYLSIGVFVMSYVKFSRGRRS